jgi:hypothetical protein
MKNIFLLYLICFFHLDFLYNSATGYCPPECQTCQKRNLELEKRVNEQETLLRHYREEISKWMKMYYEAKEACFASVEKWIKLASGQAEKLMNLCAKYTCNKC